MRSNFKIIFLFLFFLVSNSTFSQNLSVNTSQLSFGNVFENSPDSVQLTLTNSLGKDASVTGIKFYDIYGSSAFSASTNFFTIADGDSTKIWIKFSPRHNIFHNTEMVIENDGLRGYINVDLVGQGKYSNQYYDGTENKSEEDLKTSLNTITGNGYISLGYNIARDSMFMSFDNKRTNGQGAVQNTIECIYTGREAIGYTSRTDCQTNFSFNTEHTFPQSLFTSLEPMKSDLHHLFPTDDAANNERGNNPFGIVTSPTWNNGGSFSDGFIFEPRDEQKAASARALFYFTLRYQNYSNFLNSQEAILREWHNTFLPTTIDRQRNEDIFSLQNNRNPFVDYPVFTERITSLSTISVTPTIKSIDLTQDTINYGSIQPGTPVIFNYVIVNHGNSTITFTNINITHGSELGFINGNNDTVISPGESLPIQIQCLVTNTDSIRAFLTFNTDATGNSSVIIPVFVNDLIFTGVKEIFSDAIIFPNPANDRLEIFMKNYPEKIDGILFDVTGNNVFSSSFKEHCEINLSGIAKGVYILQLISEKGSVSKKVVIQ